MKKFFLFLLLTFSLLSFSDPKRLTFDKTDIDKILDELSVELSQDSQKKIQLEFTHFTKQDFINQKLEKSLLYLEASLRARAMDDKVSVEFTIIDEKDFSKLSQSLLPSMENDVHDSKVKSYFLDYETRSGKKIDTLSKNKIIEFLRPRNIKARIKEVKNSIFGTPLGVTIFDKSKKVEVLSDVEKRLKSKRAISMALRTALLAVGSFSASVAGPIGFLDFLGAPHLTSSAVLGAWVFVAIRYVENVLKVKSQGRSLLKKFHQNKMKLEFSTNKILYNSFSIVQELVSTTLITAAIMGVNNLIDAGPQMWLSVIVTNGVLSALSYAPAESYAAKYFSISKDLLKQAEGLKSQGLVKESQELINQAHKASKRASRTLDIWWNLLFPICKWGGVLMTIQTGADAHAMSNWFIGNSGLLSFAAYGVVSDFYKNIPKYRYKSKKALKRLGIFKSPTSYCETVLEIRR